MAEHFIRVIRVRRRVAAAKIITVVFVAVLINIVVVNDDGARGLTREAVEAK